MYAAQGAKRPFQFPANLFGYGKKNVVRNTPITQDASASAYQIMSDFLLALAIRTNLIPSADKKIQDVYSFMQLIDRGAQGVSLISKAELEKNLSTLGVR